MIDNLTPIVNSYKYRNIRKLIEACKRNEARGIAGLLTCPMVDTLQDLLFPEGSAEIKINDLEKGKELGGGRFGIVYHGNLNV